MIQTVYLTLKGGLSEEEAFAVQSDKGLSTLRCVLKGYRYRNGDTAKLRATKPDGTPCFLAGVLHSENSFCFTLTEEITAVEGDLPCDITLSRGEGILSSDEFLLKVRPPAAEGGEG